MPQSRKWTKANQTFLWYLSSSRNALVVLLASLIAYGVDNDQPFTLTGEVQAGLPQLSLPMYKLQEDFLSSLIDLGSLCFTLPLVAILGHVAVAKSLSMCFEIEMLKHLDRYLRLCSL